MAFKYRNGIGTEKLEAKVLHATQAKFMSSVIIYHVSLPRSLPPSLSLSLPLSQSQPTLIGDLLLHMLNSSKIVDSLTLAEATAYCSPRRASQARPSVGLTSPRLLVSQHAGVQGRHHGRVVGQDASHPGPLRERRPTGPSKPTNFRPQTRSDPSKGACAFLLFEGLPGAAPNTAPCVSGASQRGKHTLCDWQM